MIEFINWIGGRKCEPRCQIGRRQEMTHTADDFTKQTEHIIDLAIEEARQSKHRFVDTEHVLLALVADKNCTAAKILSACGITHRKVEEAVKFVTGSGGSNNGGKVELAHRAKRVIELAQFEACMLNSSYCGSEHLLLGILREKSGVAASVLESFGGTRLYTKVRDVLRSQCPRCNGKVTNTMIDYPLVLKGKLVVLRNVPAKVCSQCGELVEAQLDAELKERVRHLLEPGSVPHGTVEIPVYYLADIR